ncbi:MAG: hypothetical protein M1822_005198 [Bathelium mastoideum]|nr:MAG: hypothetical protein M1822_005198 [Bathelium mastoideum]
MGVTGSGKSTFINLLAENEVKIGHGLASCTVDVEICSFLQDGRRIYIIDTPGFDDTNRSNTEVLKDVAFSLCQIYKKKVQLAGIIYLHRITDNRMSGSSVRNLTMFKKLCGETTFPQVVLATTMWSNLEGPDQTYDIGIQRERQLIEQEDWWGPMYARGSKVVRHTGERESALKIVNELVELYMPGGPVVLDIQREMVDNNVSLEDTAAGREVGKEMREARERFQAQIRDLQSRYDEALKAKEGQIAEELLKHRKDSEDKLQKVDDATKGLQISLDRLAKEKEAEYNKLLQQLDEQQKQNKQLMLSYEEKSQQLKSERQKEEGRHGEQQRQLEKRLAEAEGRIRDVGKKYDNEATERTEDQARLAKLQKDMEARFREEQAERQHEIEELQNKMLNVKDKTRKRDMVLPILQMLAGVGTTVASIVAFC